MRKRNLVFTLVVSSLFMPSIEALLKTTDLISLKNENNLYEAVDIYIAGNIGSGGGVGGGGKSLIKKRKAALKRALKNFDYWVRKRNEAIAKGEDTTEIDKNALKWERKAITLDPTIPPSFQMMLQWEKKNKRPNMPVPKTKQPQDAIGKKGNPAGSIKKDRLSIKDNKRIRDCKEAVEYNKTDNKVVISAALRKLRKKVLRQKEKIINIQQPKNGDFSEFLDNKYARLKILDLLESHIVLLMFESKKIDNVMKNGQINKYSPNIDEAKKQLKVLQGIDIIDDKYLSSLNLDFILLKGDYSPRTIKYMKTCN